MFKIRELHQVELSSHCNLRCRYCPSKNLQRPKLYMSDEYFVKALSWVRKFADRGQQHELNIAGIGESTMHPKLVEYLGVAREVLGFDFGIVFATNGLLITEELAAAMVPYKPIVFVSLHRPEKAGPAVEILKKHNLIYGVSADPSVSATNWAGQVKWHVSATRRPCNWVQNGRVFMMADGRISRCAYDASGVGVIGHIHENLDEIQTSPYELCKACDQDVGVEIAA